MKTRRAVTETALLVVMAIVIAVLLRAFVAQAFRIPSASMVPQLEGGDRVVVSRVPYDAQSPPRGATARLSVGPAGGPARRGGPGMASWVPPRVRARPLTGPPPRI